MTVSEPLWQYLEYKAYDVRVNLCRILLLGDQDPTGTVVMVGIEEHAALKKKPLIFWYPDLGRFLKVAAQSEASAVGIDMIPFHSLEQKLAEGFKGMEGAAPPSAALNEIGRQFDNSLVEGLMQASREMAVVQGVAGSLVPYYYDLMAFMDKVKPASLRVDADPDGILRMEARNPEPEQEGFVAQLYRTTGAANQVPPQFRINFGLLDKIPIYPFEEIVNGTFDMSRLRGKVIILGMESKHEDVHDTPLGNRPGAQIHAAALETLLTGTAIVTPGRSLRFAVLAVLTLAVLPLTRYRQPLLSLCWVCGMMFVYFAAATVALAHGFNLPVFPHILAPPVIFTANYLYRYMVEERSKRQLYQTFSYYVDPVIIDRLVTQDPQTLMKGERHDVCVMFLDIRGFTALSERISSESLVSMLNTFFGRVSEIVQGNEGFVNKFIGDGMLAFFAVGDRLVDDALQASREICEATEHLNDSGALQAFIGDNRIAVGIGLHCGSVILGNIGSKRKLDFTVIGPPVNTASRIESLTKQFSRTVLVSDSVRNAASDRFSFEPLGRTDVKGIEGGVEIYSLHL
jgi:class 3 adenylate cyclase